MTEHLQRWIEENGPYRTWADFIRHLQQAELAFTTIPPNKVVFNTATHTMLVTYNGPQGLSYTTALRA